MKARWRKTSSAGCAQLGGLHTLDDFAATKGDYKTPVGTSYGGYGIHQMPPNNQGLTALLMLNVLSGFELGALDPNGAERLHLEIEAGRLAYRDRDRFIGDQDHVAVPVKELLSGAYADRLRAAIDRERAMTHLPRLDLPGSDTVYISVVDRDLNAVSLHQLDLLFLRQRRCRTEDRCHAAEPRLQLPARSEPPQQHRARQAADAHHHAGHGDARTAAP